jgi:RNA polymerase sigma factor (sigma-70 family)
MLRSQEDAEDVLQEVFTSAFNAILVDGREINVRPWLYRIATNRCINQLRRCTPVTVASLDDRCAANERTAFDELVSRQEFRDLVGDVQALPARQRTALLLCEIDGLSYQHIAVAMTTTVPAVKSLMVRARFGLLDAAAARGPQPVVPGRRRSALCNVAPQPSSVTVSGRRELAVAA